MQTVPPCVPVREPCEREAERGPVSSANGPTFTLVGDAATATAWMGRLTKSGATDRVFQVYAVCA